MSRTAGGRMRRMIAAADEAVLARVPAARPPPPGRLWPALSRASGQRLLWLGLAGTLAATQNKWARRAALRGLAGAAIASTASAAAGRRASRPPGTAATAAAFATGVALELPALALPAGLLAAAAGAARVAAGEQLPSEVAAGLAAGATAGLLTLRWWPRRQAEPAAAARPRHAAPAAPTGEGLVVVMNAASGTTSDGLAAGLAAELPDAQIMIAPAGGDLSATLEEAAGRAAILGIAGGDGSVRLAAQLAVDRGLPLLVIPAGTFNHFATDLGVRSLEDSLAALQAGDSVLVDVAQAGPRSFLNTVSTGVYVDLVQAREELEERLGKWPAVMVALFRVLGTSRPADLIVNGRRRRAWLLFAGNCRYEPPGAAPSYRPDLRDGQLDIRMIDGGAPLARLRLVAAVAMGTLARSRVYRTWTARTLTIETRDGSPLSLSIDGEAVTGEPAVTLFKRPDQLLVYRPRA